MVNFYTIRNCLPNFVRVICLLGSLIWNGLEFVYRTLNSNRRLAAENVFLRKQLALYQEAKINPKRANDATRLVMVFLSRWFDWHRARAIVQPQTFSRWHSRAFRLFWSWKSRSGRPALPLEIRQLIRRVAKENPHWGQERIANELLVKLGISVSPRTVRKYLPKPPDYRPGKYHQSQHWRTFLRNHASAIVACDFCIVATLTFRLLYVFILIEHGSRRIIYTNVTKHPTAAWTQQQLREAIPADHAYRYLIHDRDSIICAAVDQTVSNFGLEAIKTPARSPKATAICERAIGTLRRELLDYIIPLSERHRRGQLNHWVQHYNNGRPPMSLGPGILNRTMRFNSKTEHHRLQLPEDFRVVSLPILGGLHHEYALEKIAA